MDYRELASEVLRQATASGASGAEVGIVEDESFSVLVRMRGVDTVKSALEKRLGLRLFLGRRSATTATSDFSPAALDRLVADTLAMARATPEDPFGGLPDSSAFAAELPDLDLWDAEAPRLSIPDRICLAGKAESAALSFDPRITNSEGSEYGHEDARVFFANSHGFTGEYRASSVVLSATPVAKDDAGMQRDAWYSVQRRLCRLDSPESVGRTAARRTLRRLGARKVATQEVPVVFDPDMAASLMRSVCGAVSGSAIYRGASFLAGKLGQQVAATGLTLVDDGRMPGGSVRDRSTAKGCPPGAPWSSRTGNWPATSWTPTRDGSSDWPRPETPRGRSASGPRWGR